MQGVALFKFNIHNRDQEIFLSPELLPTKIFYIMRERLIPSLALGVLKRFSAPIAEEAFSNHRR